MTRIFIAIKSFVKWYTVVPRSKTDMKLAIAAIG